MAGTVTRKQILETIAADRKAEGRRTVAEYGQLHALISRRRTAGEKVRAGLAPILDALKAVARLSPDGAVTLTITPDSLRATLRDRGGPQDGKVSDDGILRETVLQEFYNVTI